MARSPIQQSMIDHLKNLRETNPDWQNDPYYQNQEKQVLNVLQRADRAYDKNALDADIENQTLPSHFATPAPSSEPDTPIEAPKADTPAPTPKAAPSYTMPKVANAPAALAPQAPSKYKTEEPDAILERGFKLRDLKQGDTDQAKQLYGTYLEALQERGMKEPSPDEMNKRFEAYKARVPDPSKITMPRDEIIKQYSDLAANARAPGNAQKMGELSVQLQALDGKNYTPDDMKRMVLEHRAKVKAAADAEMAKTPNIPDTHTTRLQYDENGVAHAEFPDADLNASQEKLEQADLRNYIGDVNNRIDRARILGEMADTRDVDQEDLYDNARFNMGGAALKMATENLAQQGKTLYGTPDVRGQIRATDDITNVANNELNSRQMLADRLRKRMELERNDATQDLSDEQRRRQLMTQLNNYWESKDTRPAREAQVQADSRLKVNSADVSDLKTKSVKRLGDANDNLSRDFVEQYVQGLEQEARGYDMMGAHTEAAQKRALARAIRNKRNYSGMDVQALEKSDDTIKDAYKAQLSAQATQGRLGLQEAKMEQERQKQLRQEVIKYGKDVRTRDIILRQFKELESLFDKKFDDPDFAKQDVGGHSVPGLGTRIPDFTGNPKKYRQYLRTRRLWQDIINGIAHEQFGSAQTLPETRKFVAAHGEGKGSDEQDWLESVKDLHGKFMDEKDDIDSAYDPEVRAMYLQNGSSGVQKSQATPDSSRIQIGPQKPKPTQVVPSWRDTYPGKK